MKLLHVEIRNCRECPHVRYELFGKAGQIYGKELAYVCALWFSYQKRRIDDAEGSGVPEWCPLPDAKEEK